MNKPPLIAVKVFPAMQPSPQIAAIPLKSKKKWGKEALTALALGLPLLRLGLSGREQILLFKRMSLLLKAGLPSFQALQTITVKASKRNRPVMEKICAGLEKGQPLSFQLEKFPAVFGGFVISMVKLGESSGSLPESLERLSDGLQKNLILKKKISGALIYPSLVACATLGITFLLTGYVFPKVLPIFQSFHSRLPWSTRFLLGANRLFSHWLLLLFTLLAVVSFFRWLLHKPGPKLWFCRRLLLTPVLGTLLKNYHLAGCCRTLAILLKNEVDIVTALNVTSKTTTNLAYKLVMGRAAQRVARGQAFSTVLEEDPSLFPESFFQMASVGENTGSLVETMDFLSKMLEEEVDESAKNLTSSIEPIMLICMGLLVGFIAISIITPIYEITQNIHP